VLHRGGNKACAGMSITLKLNVNKNPNQFLLSGKPLTGGLPDTEEIDLTFSLYLYIWPGVREKKVLDTE
jgi:hypothetical protein